MELLLGLVLVALSIVLITFARPAAAGALSRFVQKPGMGMTASLLFTVLFTAGIGLVISGLIS